MLRYKIVKQRNALDKDKKEMYYPRLTNRRKCNLYDLAEDIARRSTLSKADIIATLVSLEDIIPEYLSNGRSVDLGHLGTFSLQAHTEISQTAEEVTWRSFQSLKAKFRPGKALKVNLREVKFKRV
ncbi:MAG: hypothetical protein HC819_09890 [Cyclobacteriaceae bacterium]|nr:hypothetical protein [Cyclobacteriaceae bacterium]